MLPPTETNIQSLVRVSDSGLPSREALCELAIRLYEFSSTVTVIILGEVNRDFDSNTLESLLESFLSLDIVITGTVEVNATHFGVELYGKNITNKVISAEELAVKLGNLTDKQKTLLEQAGIVIVGIVSNSPTQPPSLVPIPAIPAWAVVVIVVLNSIIIIVVLLIILGLLLRSLRR